MDLTQLSPERTIGRERGVERCRVPGSQRAGQRNRRLPRLTLAKLFGQEHRVERGVACDEYCTAPDHEVELTVVHEHGPRVSQAAAQQDPREDNAASQMPNRVLAANEHGAVAADRHERVETNELGFRSRVGTRSVLGGGLQRIEQLLIDYVDIAGCDLMLSEQNVFVIRHRMSAGLHAVEPVECVGADTLDQVVAGIECEA